jgi:hypothetical protein
LVSQLKLAERESRSLSVKLADGKIVMANSWVRVPI